IRELLSTEQGQKALKSSGADFTKVNRAVSQLSDEEAARLAAQSRMVQKDIAAGNFTDRDLLIVLLCIAALVLIIVAVRLRRSPKKDECAHAADQGHAAGHHPRERGRQQRVARRTVRSPGQGRLWLGSSRHDSAAL